MEKEPYSSDFIVQVMSEVFKSNIWIIVMASYEHVTHGYIEHASAKYWGTKKSRYPQNVTFFINCCLAHED